MKKILIAAAVLASFAAAPLLAEDNSNKPSSDTSSGPGVKGAPGSTAGPAPVKKGDADTPSAAGGSSSGGEGMSSGGEGMSPDQDATGVKGAQDSPNGPSDRKPGDTSK